ncbi:DUF5706 domain-containing protein [Streptomyces kunmingensis]|uniref:DUF5706 domain-containing protein n=1 Tax=Streptomyces kunmingensis TaxID=68225 RepID=A0ABU6CJQ8_9ACTN|nr:Pycsar system effector family protein [Streptomyces kunmingensis]MEB3964944.1 DUF5706 domain-containing protein [Streptomyces kunmingensis]
MSAISPGTPAPLPPPGVRAAERLLAELRTEIARADAKAAVAVAALGVAAGVLGGLLAGQDWRPASLSPLGATTWWSGVTGLIVTLLALLMAVVPRRGRTRWAHGAPLSYFGDVQQAARSGHLAQALAETERVPATGALIALTETSRIAARKHQWIRVGLTALGASVVLLTTPLLIG